MQGKSLLFKALKRSLLISAVTASILSEPAKSQNTCSAVIQQVTNDVQGRLGASIDRVSIEKSGQFFGGELRSPFNNADEIVTFYLRSDMGRGTATPSQARAAYNIMQSSSLIRSYAEQIIKNCDPVVSVKFHYWSEFMGWSLLPGGSLSRDKCKFIGDDPNGRLGWGEHYCS